MEKNKTSDSSPTSLYKAEYILSLLLRYGVILSAVLIGLGLFLEFLHPTSSEALNGLILDLTQGKEINGFHPVVNAGEVLHGVFQWNPQILVTSGLMVLMALPIVRVGMTVILFLLDQDWIFLGITFFVFSVLISSLFIGSVI